MKRKKKYYSTFSICTQSHKVTISNLKEKRKINGKADAKTANTKNNTLTDQLNPELTDQLDPEVIRTSATNKHHLRTSFAATDHRKA